MLNSLISFVTIIFLFLFPLFYLPITSESYDYNKMALLVVTDLLLLILLGLKFLREKKFYFIRSTFTFPLFIIAGISFLSALFISPHLLSSLTTPLGTATLIAGFIFYLVLTYILSFGLVQIRHIMTIFILDAVLLSFYYFLSYFNFFPNNSFTPAGNLLAAATFLAVITAYLLMEIIMNFAGRSMLFEHSHGPEHHESAGGGEVERIWEVRKKAMADLSKIHLVTFAVFLLVLSTTVFLTYQLTTTQKPVILPFEYGWVIALEILKNIKTLFLGVGPANFITAFVVAKPLAFNSTPFWNVIFTSSSSFFLNLVTEIGAVAGFFYLLLIIKTVKSLSSLLHSPFSIFHYPLSITLLFSLLLPLFLPSSLTLFILTIVLLALCSEIETKTLSSYAGVTSAFFFLAFSLCLAGSVLFFGGKIYLADVYFKSSLSALLNNKPQETYNLQKKALELAPGMDRYHLVFSQTNLAMAQSIASKKDLTAEDKQYLPRLVFQAIDQARTAVNLYRTNIINWDNLAKTYVSLVNYAAGADEWAIASYRQKIFLDPLSPSNHLALGNVFKLMNKFDLAAEEFAKAIKLKPDIANAHYQLGLVLKASGKNKEADAEFKTTLSLLPVGSSEIEMINKEMESSAPAPTITPVPESLQNLPDTFPTISIEKAPAN